MLANSTMVMMKLGRIGLLRRHRYELFNENLLFFIIGVDGNW